MCDDFGYIYAFQFHRPLQSRYIRIYEEGGEEVVTIDVASSSSVIYPADSLGREITFTTNYLFTVNRRYYVLLDPGRCRTKSL